MILNFELSQKLLNYLKIYTHIAFVFVLFCSFVKCNIYAQTNWDDAKREGKATLIFYYYNVKPFFYQEEESLKGPEHELVEEFRKYIEKKHNIKVTINFQGYEEFPKYYERVKRGESGEFGIGTTSITEKRLKEVKMSKPYLPDIDIMVNSPNLSMAKDTAQWLKLFKNAKAVTIPNSAFEKSLLELKKIKPDLKFEYVLNRGKVREKLIENKDLFALYPLPDYLYWHKEGIKLQRQTLFSLERKGYGIIMPRKSDWDTVLDDFLDDAASQKTWESILEKHFGKEIHQFINAYSKEKNKEMALLNQEKLLQGVELEKNQILMKLQQSRQNMLYWGLLVVAVIIILVSVLVFIQIKSNQILKLKNKEIEHQKHELEENYGVLTKQNKQITDSIKVAKAIQTGILPFSQRIKYTLGEENFIIYKPKDIVSGDFYWLGNVAPSRGPMGSLQSEKIFLALSDCTGHGVPGAFMTMLGYSFLNDIINSQDIHVPSKILSTLHRIVRKALVQDNGNNEDGMDVAIVCIEKINEQKYKVTFSGAKRNLLVFTDNQIIEFQGDRKSIGGGADKKDSISFNDVVIQLNKGDMLYLYSDGFTDAANINRRSLGKKKLVQKLENIANLPCAEQKNQLEEMLEEHQKDTEQRDDITLWGVRLTI